MMMIDDEGLLGHELCERCSERNEVKMPVLEWE
jgi:hypothetical protein